MKIYSLVFLFTLLLNVTNAQTLIYVNANATGSNNGTSWANAYDSLQNALNAASLGDQIWVAAGVYKPSDTTRSVSFNLKGGLTIVGGFAGTETSISHRNWVTNPTYISGDIGTVGDSLDNTRTIIVFKNSEITTILDGFIIEDGYNDFNSINSNRGVGVYLFQSSLNIDHCIFRNNVSVHLAGGAIFADSSSGMTIKNTQFINNNAEQGASIYQQYYCTLTVDSCKFLNNYSADAGAGICSYDSCTMVVSNSQFSKNKMGDEGTIEGNHYCDLNLTNCSFDSSSAIEGAAVAFYQSNNPVTITGCSFTNNITEAGGGALMLYCSVAINNCSFKNNSSSQGGAATFYNKAVIQKSQFIANSSRDNGSAIYYYSDSILVVDSCTFSNNVCAGGNYCQGSAINVIGPLKLTNSTFNNNYAGSGGALVIPSGDAYIDNCQFNSNSTYTNNTGYGGTIDFGSGKLYLTNSSINGGRATDGGAIDLEIGSAFISNCTFSNDTAFYGGAIANGDSLIIENSKFINNKGMQWYSQPSQGAVLWRPSYFKISNSLFLNNSADINGAIYAYSTKENYIISCSFSGNKSDSGAIYNVAPLNIINSILWNDTVPEIFNSQGYTANVQYSLVQGGYSGTGNISADPEWDNNFILTSGSPAINIGTPDTTGLFISAYDLDSNKRIIAGTIDMGAYEYTGAPTAISKSQQNNAGVIVYPNPCKGFTNFVINRAITSDNQLVVELTDINGKVIKTESILLNPAGNTIYKLELENITSGLYIYKIQGQSGTISMGKLIIER